MEARKYRLSIVRYVEDYDIADGGCYASSWGLTDLYDSCGKNLKSLLDSGKDFRAAWSSKKELQSVTLLRSGETMNISVNVWMDDLWESDDLIYDAYYDVTGSEDEIPEETIDAIKDFAFEVGCDDSTYATWEGKCPDYDTIMKHIEGLADEADRQLTKHYECLKAIVKEMI